MWATQFYNLRELRLLTEKKLHVTQVPSPAVFLIDVSTLHGSRMITKHYFSFCAKGLFQMDPLAAKEHTGMMNNILERINPSLHLISGRHRIYLEFYSLCRSISLTSEPFTSCWRDHPLPPEKFIETMKHPILIMDKLVGMELPCSTWKSVQDTSVGGVMKTGNMISTNPG